MKIYNKLKIGKKHKNCVVAIGNFDGVHLGHQRVLREAKIKSRKERLPFEPEEEVNINIEPELG